MDGQNPSYITRALSLEVHRIMQRFCPSAILHPHVPKEESKVQTVPISRTEGRAQELSNALCCTQNDTPALHLSA